MSMKVVLKRMAATAAMSKNMVRLPLRLDASAADITSPAGAFKNARPLGLRQLPSSNMAILLMTLLPCLVESPEAAS
jgi:hypothetical protein